MRVRLLVAAFMAIAAILLAGCADSDPGVLADVGQGAGTDQVAQSVTTSLAPQTESSSTTTSPASDPDDDGFNPFGGNDPEDRLMPEVVCMGLQEAQDEIQDHGVFYSKSVDATGADRMQILDRNWVVVEQEPAPGTPIGEGDAILHVVKYSETDACK